MTKIIRHIRDYQSDYNLVKNGCTPNTCLNNGLSEVYKFHNKDTNN
jgi:hypothetical protein